MKSTVDESVARTVARIYGNDLAVVDDIGLRWVLAAKTCG
jgi:hypothetical protein